MKLLTLIDRIKAQCPAFGSRVFGAAEFAAARLTEDAIAVPACFVIRAGGSAGESEVANRVLQVRAVTFIVSACLDNTTDERGQQATEQLDDVEAEIFAALIGWDPTPADGTDWPLELGEDAFLDMDRARYWHQWEFTHQTQVSNL